MDNLPSAKTMCHRTGFKKSCRVLVDKGVCPRWTNVVGADPQTGEPVNNWKCADDWGPFLQLELGRKLHEMGAAIESLRNLTITSQEQLTSEIIRLVSIQVSTHQLLQALSGANSSHGHDLEPSRRQTG